MILSKTIGIIANEVKAQLSNKTEDHLKLLDAIAKMPKYYNQKRLDLWEQNYTKIYKALPLKSKKDHNISIIKNLFDLGAHNLYGAFEKKTTIKKYKELVTELSTYGITIPSNLDVSDW